MRPPAPVPAPDPAQEEPRPDPHCPFCRSDDVEVISLFGTHAMLLQYRCRSCASYFEASKYVADSPTDYPPAPNPPT